MSKLLSSLSLGFVEESHDHYTTKYRKKWKLKDDPVWTGVGEEEEKHLHTIGLEVEEGGFAGIGYGT